MGTQLPPQSLLLPLYPLSVLCKSSSLSLSYSISFTYNLPFSETAPFPVLSASAYAKSEILPGLNQCGRINVEETLHVTLLCIKISSVPKDLGGLASDVNLTQIRPGPSQNMCFLWGTGAICRSLNALGFLSPSMCQNCKTGVRTKAVPQNKEKERGGCIKDRQHDAD